MTVNFASDFIDTAHESDLIWARAKSSAPTELSAVISCCARSLSLPNDAGGKSRAARSLIASSISMVSLRDARSHQSIKYPGLRAESRLSGSKIKGIRP